MQGETTMKNLERYIKTEMAYSKRLKGLMASINEYTTENYDKKTKITPDILTEWFLLHTKLLSGSTFRQYKNSLVYFFETSGRKDLETALRSLTRKEFPEPKPKIKRTSAMKTKRVTEADEETITKHLSKKTENIHENTLNNRTYVYFKSTIITGLRPSEWIASKLEHNYKMPDGTIEKTVLIVKNGKASNGRSHGENRHVILSEISDADIKIVSTHRRFLYEHLLNGNNFDKYYNACRGKLARTCKTCWPRRKTRVSLYSGRHQFSANLKANGATRPEVAATMGHGSDETATKHYGRKTAGKRGPTARSASHEVKRVRLVFIPFVPKKPSTGPRLG